MSILKFNKAPRIDFLDQSLQSLYPIPKAIWRDLIFSYLVDPRDFSACVRTCKFLWNLSLETSFTKDNTPLSLMFKVLNKGIKEESRLEIKEKDEIFLPGKNKHLLAIGRDGKQYFSPADCLDGDFYGSEIVMIDPRTSYWEKKLVQIQTKPKELAEVIKKTWNELLYTIRSVHPIENGFLVTSNVACSLWTYVKGLPQLTKYFMAPKQSGHNQESIKSSGVLKNRLIMTTHEGKVFALDYLEEESSFKEIKGMLYFNPEEDTLNGDCGRLFWFGRESGQSFMQEIQLQDEALVAVGKKFTFEGVSASTSSFQVITKWIINWNSEKKSQLTIFDVNTRKKCLQVKEGVNNWQITDETLYYVPKGESVPRVIHLLTGHSFMEIHPLWQKILRDSEQKQSICSLSISSLSDQATVLDIVLRIPDAFEWLQVTFPTIKPKSLKKPKKHSRCTLF